MTTTEHRDRHIPKHNLYSHTSVSGPTKATSPSPIPPSVSTFDSFVTSTLITFSDSLCSLFVLNVRGDGISMCASYYKTKIAKYKGTRIGLEVLK